VSICLCTSMIWSIYWAASPSILTSQKVFRINHICINLSK
jgi:predicted alpha/beta superfamily hydrolase